MSDSERLNSQSIGKEQLFKERMSDEHLGELISAVGNSPAKALLLASLVSSGKRYFSRSDLRTVFNSVAGPRDLWPQEKSMNVVAYCSYSFEPVGLIVKADIDGNGTLRGFGTTEKAETEAFPLVGLLCDYSLMYDVPLLPLFGNTSSPSTRRTEEGDTISRAPTNRLKLIGEIATRPGNTFHVRDLVASLDLPNVIVGKHLQTLSHAGLVSYDGASHDMREQRYTLLDKGPPDLSSFDEQVISILESNGALTIKEIQQELLDLGASNEYTPNKLKHCIGNLRKLGAIVGVDKHADPRGISGSISGEQQAKLVALLNLLHDFQNRDKNILAEGKDLAVELVQNSDKNSRLIEQFLQHSPSINAKNKEERMNDILAIAVDSGQPLSIKAIAQILKKRGETISPESLRKIVLALEEEGRITVDKQGRQFFISPL